MQDELGLGDPGAVCECHGPWPGGLRAARQQVVVLELVTEAEIAGVINLKKLNVTDPSVEADSLVLS